MSKFQLMRFLFALIFCGVLSVSPLLAQESSSTVPPAAAESGKDVVHALNNAFAKVFEIVAPSVVIIEVSKKNDAKDLPVVQMGDSDAVRVGQFAFAIGAPFKLDYTFTYGVVSGKGRSKLFTNGGYSISDYIQTDASINPGNSGGPLCDIDGKVIGMNTLINGLNRGLGFAIPSNLANEIGQQLVAGKKIARPWLGIRIESNGGNPNTR